MTSGAVSVKEALAVGAVLALLAFGLVLSTNTITIGMSFAALAVTLAYPYAKRFVSMPQAVLGVAFGMGIPMAFAAVRGAVPTLAWFLFLGNLFWVLAYDTEYAMVDRDDDLALGIKTSAITLGLWDVPAVMLCYLLFIAIWTLSLMQQMKGAIFVIAILAASGQMIWHFELIRRRTREGCFTAFRKNHWLGFAVFAGIAASFAVK